MSIPAVPDSRREPNSRGRDVKVKPYRVCSVLYPMHARYIVPASYMHTPTHSTAGGGTW